MDLDRASIAQSFDNSGAPTWRPTRDLSGLDRGLANRGRTWGRPVDVLVMPNGA